MFVSIFVLVGAYARTNELTEKCIIPNKNFFKQFFYLEYFFQESNNLLCSSGCPCSLTDNTIDEYLIKKINLKIKYIIFQILIMVINKKIILKIKIVRKKIKLEKE